MWLTAVPIPNCAVLIIFVYFPVVCRFHLPMLKRYLSEVLGVLLLVFLSHLLPSDEILFNKFQVLFSFAAFVLCIISICSC